MNKINHEIIKKRASNNLQQYGRQDYETLSLRIAKQEGALADTILNYKYGAGREDRIHQEAIDLGALCLQVMEHWNGDHLPDIKE